MLRLEQGKSRLGQGTGVAGLAVDGSGDGGTGVGRGCTKSRQWTGAAVGDMARERSRQLERRQGTARDLGSGTGWLTAR